MSEVANEKICYLYKVMAKKRIGTKIWPFPLYFEVILAGKWPFQGRHFPCEFRAHPYLFGIRRARGMGLDNSRLNFEFFCSPPSAYMCVCLFVCVRVCLYYVSIFLPLSQRYQKIPDFLISRTQLPLSKKNG